ncbi:MAG: peptidoglycan editing factor PgeF [Rickettsiales bacterium]|nr:peptidoglycan editing factor PgeF [Rickettsiales bacterium]
MDARTHQSIQSLPHVRHAFFGRGGGISEGIYTSLNCGPGSADTPEHIAENRRRVTAHFGKLPNQLCTLFQTHSNRVVFVGSPLENYGTIRADALVTNRTGLLLGVLTADCAPVLFADKEHDIVAAAHAGWKGAIRGILENTIEAMCTYGAKKECIIACIGPCLAQESYEVGREFYKTFLDHDPETLRLFTSSKHEGAYQFDLEGYVKYRLINAGIHFVHSLQTDTYANPEKYFSYRHSCHKNEPDYGRQISAITLVSRFQVL